jgi:hypothetical protein
MSPSSLKPALQPPSRQTPHLAALEQRYNRLVAPLCLATLSHSRCPFMCAEQQDCLLHHCCPGALRLATIASTLSNSTSVLLHRQVHVLHHVMPLESSATVRCRLATPCPDRPSRSRCALDHFQQGVCTSHTPLVSPVFQSSSSWGPAAGVRPVRKASTPHHPVMCSSFNTLLPACSCASCTVARLSDPRPAPTTERSTRSGRAHLSALRLYVVGPSTAAASGDARPRLSGGTQLQAGLSGRRRASSQ